MIYSDYRLNLMFFKDEQMPVGDFIRRIEDELPSGGYIMCKGIGQDPWTYQVSFTCTQKPFKLKNRRKWW